MRAGAKTCKVSFSLLSCSLNLRFPGRLIWDELSPQASAGNVSRGKKSELMAVEAFQNRNPIDVRARVFTFGLIWHKAALKFIAHMGPVVASELFLSVKHVWLWCAFIRSFSSLSSLSACVCVGVIVRLGALCVQQAARVQLHTGWVSLRLDSTSADPNTHSQTSILGWSGVKVGVPLTANHPEGAS